MALDVAQTSYLTTETVLGEASVTLAYYGSKVLDKTGQIIYTGGKILLNEGKFATETVIEYGKAGVEVISKYGKDTVNWLSNPYNRQVGAKATVDFIKGYAFPVTDAQLSFSEFLGILTKETIERNKYKK